MIVPTTEHRLSVRQRPNNRSPVMYQNWEKLLFLHWKWNAEEIQKTLPDGLLVDTFNGNAYLGLVPFYMRKIRPRFLPAVWGISNFLEMNLRTYVYDKRGRPGVWFYSLDANQWLAVHCAKTFFNLPYYNAQIVATTKKDSIHYKAQRKGVDLKYDTEIVYDQGELHPEFSLDSLEFFLVERYLLFAVDRNKTLYSGQVYHEPYPLYESNLEIISEGTLELAGFKKSHHKPDHVIMSQGVVVDVFALEELC